MVPRLDISFSIKRQVEFVCGVIDKYPLNTYMLNHARVGIVMMLQALLPKGSRVGMMCYNCHTVMNAIVEAGMVPVFIDVDEELRLDMQSLKQQAESLDGIIVTHLFGIRNDIQAIRAICPTALIIEDSAHGYGIEPAESCDATVYSINQGKFPSIGEGGILRGHSKWKEQIDTAYSKLPSYSQCQHWKLFCMMLLKSWLYTPWLYTLFTKPILKDHHTIGQVREPILMRKMDQGVRKMYHEVQSMVPAMIVERKRNAETIQQICRILPEVEQVMIGENAFMVVVRSRDIVATKNYFRRQGVEADTHFKHCIEWAMQFGYTKGSCPTAERLVHELVMIPTYCRIVK